MTATAPSFATDIKPLFRESDRTAMPDQAGDALERNLGVRLRGRVLCGPHRADRRAQHEVMPDRHRAGGGEERHDGRGASGPVVDAVRSAWPTRSAPEA